jgi:hypothetical protein
MRFTDNVRPFSGACLPAGPPRRAAGRGGSGALDPVASAPSPPTAQPEQATAVALRLNTAESIAVDGVLDEAAWERYPNDIWSGRLILKEFQKNFDPAIGFRQRDDTREYDARRSNNIQYDSGSRVLGWQLRFRWITQPGNDIYFVWMTNWIDTEERLATLDRNGAIKLLYTYRL